MLINKTIKLNNGNEIPLLGLGTWKTELNLASETIEYAIKTAGYRHIDCASIYGNEKEVGEGLQKAKKTINRKDLFITSKLWGTDFRPENVEKACKKTLSDLKLDYLDLYLMHWGVALKPNLGELEPLDKDGRVITDNVSTRETWEAMEELVKKGLVKSIGVANFTATMIIDLLTYAKIIPAMNQIELHPYNTQQDLIDYCKYKTIAVTAYSPLGRPGAKNIQGPRLFDDPVIKTISKRYDKTPAQILLNWGIKRETVVIPKSTYHSRIMENIDIFDFELSDEEMKQISSLNKNHRFVHPGSWWGIPYFS